MKKVFLVFILGAGAIVSFPGCNDNTSTEKTTTDSVTSTAPKTDSVLPGTSNEFVTKATQGGMMEVELGKLAQKNGASQDVKDYGKMLEEDHSKANATLQSTATAENILLPTAMTDDQAKHIKEMEAMKGGDFDKHFISMMVDDHGKDIEEFKKAATGNPNEKIKDFAAKTLPTLETHLAKAKAIKSKMK